MSSDDWNFYVGSEYKALYKAKTEKEKSDIIARINKKLPYWLEGRKDIIKKGEEWHEADKEEELRQSQNGEKITEFEAITLLAAEVIRKAISDLRRKKEKVLFIKKVKDKNRKIKESKLMDENQIDAYKFLFEDENLERFLMFWNYELDANFLRRKIAESFDLSDMQESPVLQKLNILALETLGKKP